MLAAVPLMATGCFSWCEDPTSPEELTCPTVVVEPALAQGSPGDVVSVVVEAVGGDPDRWVVQLTPVAGAMPTTFEELDRLSSSLPPVRASVQIPASTVVGRYTQTFSLGWGGVGTAAIKCGFEQPTVSFEIDVVAPPPPPTPPSFTATVTPSALSIEQGDSASVAVSVTREGGFAGAISAELSAVPEAVTASVGQIAAGSNGSTIGFVAGLEAAPGTDTLTLTLSGTGVTSRTLPIVLTITERPDFDFVLAADSQTVYQGEAGAPIGVSITRRGGFAGEITLEVEGVPSNVTATVESPGTGDAGSITFEAAPDTAQGGYELTVRARAADLGDKTQSFTLTVLPPPALYLVMNPFVRTAPSTSASVAIEIDRISWEGEVTLSVTQAPAGITAAFNPAATTGDETTLELQIGEVAPGDYQVAIAAEGATGLSTTGVIFITVTAPER